MPNAVPPGNRNLETNFADDVQADCPKDVPMSPLKKGVRSLLLDSGVWIERAAPDSAILELLGEMRPRESSIPLRRFGSAGDGGYLIPDDLEGIGACISPGVSTECSFDRDIANLGIDVFMADASVEGPPETNARFHFSKLFLDTFKSADTVTLDEFCRPVAPGRDLLLEMDIEGAEYRVLNSVSDELLSRFRIMAIEFHYLDSLFTPFGLREISTVFRRLLRTHTIVHIHPNNVLPPVGHGVVRIPPAMEFTFLRKDRSVFGDHSLAFPHPLDSTNLGDLPGYALPECWYRPVG